MVSRGLPIKVVRTHPTTLPVSQIEVGSFMRVVKWTSICLLLIFIGSFVVSADSARTGEVQQIVVSPTPLQFNLPVASLLPSTQPTELSLATATATPLSQVLLEALTEANVRAQPDTESERLGTIRAGDTYPVLGRYFRWFQFQYNQSPTGIGWVFDELVRIIGDKSAIPDLTEATPQSASEGILATPDPNQIALPIFSAATASLPTQIATLNVLPTYTYPPNVDSVGLSTASGQLQITSEATVNENQIVTPSRSIPPILPILILGGLGVLGLLISTRRG